MGSFLLRTRTSVPELMDAPDLDPHAHAEALAGLSNVSTVPLNGYDLTGVGDASFDVVYCTGVFMHLDEWERFRYIADAYRVLRPGGRIYVDNFNLLSDEGWALFESVVRLDPAGRPPNVSRASTGEELRTYVTRAGYEDVAIDRSGLWVSVSARKPTQRTRAT